MNGPHDLGGQMGFGPVAPELNEPVFHADWERRALGLTLCVSSMRQWPGDENRFTRESLHPADYYSSSYYEIWTKAAERLLVKYGFVTGEELRAGRKLSEGAKPRQMLAAADVPAVLAKGAPYDRPITAAPKFATGQRVRTINEHPRTHTRLPRFARGRIGRIETVHGGFVFPDANARGLGEQPQRLYTVVFAGTELWGAHSDPSVEVSIDAWESYLEAA